MRVSAIGSYHLPFPNQTVWLINIPLGIYQIARDANYSDAVLAVTPTFTFDFDYLPCVYAVFYKLQYFGAV